MSNIVRGIVAGFAATVVLSGMMVMKSMMGVMPELDVIAMLSKMMESSSSSTGWMLHFLTGTFAFGGLFALIEQSLPGESYWAKGVWFGIGIWLAMMVMVVPMAGAGLFGVGFGMMAPIITLVLHIIFGEVLGGTFALLSPEDSSEYGAFRR